MMVDLLDKHKGILERVQRMTAMGINGLGVTNDRMISPTRAMVGNREIILAGTNNYMGITFDPRCIAAGQKALAEFGTGTTGSRIANGSFALHSELERELASFLGLKHCIIFTTGYQANLGMLSGLAGPNDTIFLDADSHSSIYDGCTLSGAKLVRFRHNDAADLDKRMARAEGTGGGRLVVLEGIYSMLGDRAPLKDFVALKKKHQFQLCVDDAHSFGVLGPHGRGLGDEAGLEDDVDFVIGTFSKSVGAIGGFGASNHPLFESLRYTMRPYMFTASASPASIATSIEALKILKAEPERRTK
ncbi:MAG TPA: aminotransferase class I/II-fold pyridoxal phosphate-dependent enzyme, partial [Aestuariivirga sp.]